MIKVLLRVVGMLSTFLYTSNCFAVVYEIRTEFLMNNAISSISRLSLASGAETTIKSKIGGESYVIRLNAKEVEGKSESVFLNYQIRLGEQKQDLANMRIIALVGEEASMEVGSSENSKDKIGLRVTAVKKKEI